MIEELEKLRNVRFAFRRGFSKNSMHRLSEIISVIEANSWPDTLKLDDIVSFAGFYNEFDDVIGNKCVYLVFPNERKIEWLAYRAISHGAIAVISEYQIGDLPCIIVNNIWDALKKISVLYFQNFKGKTTAIAGSIGKTTTKEMVYSVYSQKYKAFCTPNNGNVLRYLAYEIQHMPMKIQQFVQEVDESYDNNSEDCSYILKPSVVLITSIDNSHIGTLGGEKAVSESILNVTKYMKDDGVIIINGDDPKSDSTLFTHKVIRVGIDNLTSDCVASNIKIYPFSVDFTVKFAGETANIHLCCPGKHNIYNAMMAFVAGKLNGISTRQIKNGLKKYRPMTVRQKYYHAGGRLLYVDCFNASARSVDVALKVIANNKTKKSGSKIAVIGDIAEIQGYETETYQKIANSICGNGIDYLFTYGRDCEEIWSFLPSKIMGKHYYDRDELIDGIRARVNRGDVVLFKASHSMDLEHVVFKLYPVAYIIGRIPYWIKLGKYLIQTI